MENSNDFYEDVYFDTDEENEESVGIGLPGGKKTGRKILTNEELLYDPELDEKDEDWVIKQVEAAKENRHEKYGNQFRAMFVHNCHVIKNERYQPKDAQENEHYQKVACDQCGVHVAMMDQDEIYHFFNVVPTA